MKNWAVGSSRLAGICEEKLQVALVGLTAVLVAGLMKPVQPFGVMGVPKAERAKTPFPSGPSDEKGSYKPLFAIEGSSLKSPWCIRAVGTENVLFPIRWRMVESQEKKKKVLFRPSYRRGSTTGPPSVPPKLLKRSWRSLIRCPVE